MLPLVLYDIPSKLPGNDWSPNPAKPRFVLGYKNLPFETVWVEAPDIAPRLKEIGAAPTMRQDGEKYTVPVLSDPNTGALVSDSWVIAEYLDKTYPEKLIFPDGSKGLISAFNSALFALMGEFVRFGLLRSSEIVNDRTREHFLSGAWGMFGTNVDEWSPEGPKRDAHWAVIERDFYGSAKTWYEQAEGMWVMGDAFSYADIILATYTLWFKRICREDEWQRIASMHDGRWGRLLADAERECNLA